MKEEQNEVDKVSVNKVVAYEGERGGYAIECIENGMRFVDKHLGGNLYVTAVDYLEGKTFQLMKAAGKEKSDGLVPELGKGFLSLLDHEIEPTYYDGLVEFYHVGSLEDAWNTMLAGRLLKAA